jgi:hypothetical protein
MLVTIQEPTWHNIPVDNTIDIIVIGILAYSYVVIYRHDFFLLVFKIASLCFYIRTDSEEVIRTWGP